MGNLGSTLAQWTEFVATCGASADRDVLVVVDPISTGLILVQQALARGLEVVAVWSESVPDQLKQFVAKGINVRYIGVVQHEEGALASTTATVRAIVGDRRLRAVLVGCETGVLLGDELSEALGVPTNGTANSPLRRNKWLQTEAVRDAGLNACGQYLVNSTKDVEKVLKAWPKGKFKAVVKPVVGAGSDGVSICDTHQQVRDAFRALEGTKNVLGLTTYEVLIQEYLVGEEYVVDCVSRDGEHKCVAIWKYDKRVYNASPVVYFGMELLEVDAEPALRAMVTYTLKVLDAIGIRHGAMHCEIKLEPRGPVLIEVNCRLHGGEGTWAPMSEACLGYSMVSALLDATLEPEAFAALPPLPTAFKSYAMEAKLRSPVDGVLKSIDEKGMATIRALPSYTTEMLAVSVGRPIARTIDAVSACGNINLVNADKYTLNADYAKLHEVVGKGLFETEEGEAEPEATSLSHFLAQSPPSSPAARAFRTFTPSPKDGNAPGGRPVLPLAPSPPPAERVVIRA